MTAHRHSSVSFWYLFIFNNSSTSGQCFLYWGSCFQAVIWKGQYHYGTCNVPKVKASDHILGCCLLRQGENCSPAPQRPFLCQVPHLLRTMLDAGGGRQAQELEEAECNKNCVFASSRRKTGGGGGKPGKGRLLTSQVLL